MFCRKCGTELPDNAKFCPVCGESMPNSLPNQKEVPEHSDSQKSVNSRIEQPHMSGRNSVPGGKNRKLFLFIGIAAVIAVVILIAGVASNGRKQKVQESAEQSEWLSNVDQSEELQQSAPGQPDNAPESEAESISSNSDIDEENRSFDPIEMSEEDVPADEEVVPEDYPIITNAERNGLFPQKGAVTDADGVLYSSDNVYTLEDRNTDDSLDIDLNGLYQSVKGGICVLDKHGDHTMVLQFIGDGETLYERRFPEPGQTIQWGYIPVNFDVSGVNRLKIRFFSSNNGNSLVYNDIKIGLIDFVATEDPLTPEELDAAREAFIMKEPVDFVAASLSENASWERKALTTPDGVLHDSRHVYALKVGSDGGFLVTQTNGQYERLEGDIFFYVLHENSAVYRFEILADDEAIYTHDFACDNEEDLNNVFHIDLDIQDVNTLELHFYRVKEGRLYDLDRHVGLLDLMMYPVGYEETQVVEGTLESATEVGEESSPEEP